MSWLPILRGCWKMIHARAFSQMHAIQSNRHTSNLLLKTRCKIYYCYFVNFATNKVTSKRLFYIEKIIRFNHIVGKFPKEFPQINWPFVPILGINEIWLRGDVITYILDILCFYWSKEAIQGWRFESFSPGSEYGGSSLISGVSLCTPKYEHKVMYPW